MEKMKEIDELWDNVHQYHKLFKQEGYSRKKLMKKILKKTFGRESIIGQLTQNDLSRENMIISLLKWEKNK